MEIANRFKEAIYNLDDYFQLLPKSLQIDYYKCFYLNSLPTYGIMRHLKNANYVDLQYVKLKIIIDDDGFVRNKNARDMISDPYFFRDFQAIEKGLIIFDLTLQTKQGYFSDRNRSHANLLLVQKDNKETLMYIEPHGIYKAGALERLEIKLENNLYLDLLKIMMEMNELDYFFTNITKDNFSNQVQVDFPELSQIATQLPVLDYQTLKRLKKYVQIIRHTEIRNELIELLKVQPDAEVIDFRQTLQYDDEQGYCDTIIFIMYFLVSLTQTCHQYFCHRNPDFVNMNYLDIIKNLLEDFSLEEGKIGNQFFNSKLCRLGGWMCAINIFLFVYFSQNYNFNLSVKDKDLIDANRFFQNDFETNEVLTNNQCDVYTSDGKYLPYLWSRIKDLETRLQPYFRKMKLSDELNKKFSKELFDEYQSIQLGNLEYEKMYDNFYKMEKEALEIENVGGNLKNIVNFHYKSIKQSVVNYLNQLYPKSKYSSKISKKKKKSLTKKVQSRIQKLFESKN